jgi:predicted lipid carrier protein YhbT
VGTHPYLSPEWHAAVVALAAEALPDRPGASALLACKVTGSPSGDLHYVQQLVDGRLVRQEPGRAESPDVSFTVTWADAVALLRGELDPNVLVMQGRMKADGNIGRLMAILPVTTSADYLALQEQVRAITAV